MDGIYQLLFLLLYYIPFVCFLVTLQNTLKSISTENRKMKPTDVWFSIIPLFGIAWQFNVVNKIADSIKNECKTLNIFVKEKRPTYHIGLVYCISFLLFLIPAFKGVGSLIVIITWIVYWIKVYQYKKLLIANKNTNLANAE